MSKLPYPSSSSYRQSSAEFTAAHDTAGEMGGPKGASFASMRAFALRDSRTKTDRAALGRILNRQCDADAGKTEITTPDGDSFVR